MPKNKAAKAAPKVLLPGPESSLSDVKPVWIALTMVVAFCATLGYAWLREPRAVAPSPTVASLMSTAPAPRAAPKFTPPPVAAAPQVKPAPAASPEAAPELPVNVSFRHPPRLDRTVARLSSRVDEPLDIKVKIESASEQRTLYHEVMLEANGQGSFGQDTDVDLKSGDKLTLLSASYRPTTVAVP